MVLRGGVKWKGKSRKENERVDIISSRGVCYSNTVSNSGRKKNIASLIYDKFRAYFGLNFREVSS